MEPYEQRTTVSIKDLAALALLIAEQQRSILALEEQQQDTGDVGDGGTVTIAGRSLIWSG